MRIEVEVVGKDKASKVLEGIGKSISALGTVAATAGMAAAAAVVGIGAAVTKMTLDAAAVEGTRKTFGRLAEDIGTTSDALTKDLREATRGMVKDADLWAASNKFVAMGITDTAESTAEMAKMATQLGMAMGEEATPSMENFALMMANQSIPRLDSFGISSSAVRERVKELMDSTAGLTREQAFNQAVMEEGRKTMERVGEQGDTTAATMDRIRATFANTTQGIGQAFLPILDQLATSLQGLAEEYGPMIVEWAGMAATWLGEKIPIAIEWLRGAWEEWWPKARDGLMNFWTTIKPALIWIKDTFTSFTEAILPKLKEAWDILREGWTEISELYKKELKPALDELWEALGLGKTKSDDIGGAMGSFAGVLAKFAASGVIDVIKTGIKLLAGVMDAGRIAGYAVRDMIDKARHSFWSIVSVIDHVRGVFNDFKRTVSDFSLPSWLTPGSPTPLEIGLLGIADALSQVQEISTRGLIARQGGDGTISTNQSTTNQFNMTVNTGAGRAAVQQGFATMRALA